MDRCSNSGESTQTRERIRREAHEKVEKSRETLCCSNVLWLRRVESRKVGLLKRRVRSQLAGKMREEKLHAAVARSACRSQKVQRTCGALLEAEITKKRLHFGASGRQVC